MEDDVMAIGFHNSQASPQRPPYHPRAGILSRELICVHADDNLREAGRLMRENHIGDLVVVREENGRKQPVGLVTDRDLAIETFGQEVSGDNLLVGDIMSRDLVTASVHDDIFQLIERMKSSGVSRLPLVDDEGNVTGIITAKRLTRILLEGLNDLFEMSEQRKENELSQRS
jgi:CBS domain-containing protein